jgi:hypothetical protein
MNFKIGIELIKQFLSQNRYLLESVANFGGQYWWQNFS